MIKHLVQLLLKHKVRLPLWRKELVVYSYLLVLYAVILYLLLSLGQWQLARQQEKITLLQQITAKREQAPVALPQEILPSDDYLRVNLAQLRSTGIQVYIANEPYKGQDGYHILALYQLSNERDVWLNRGWIRALPDRRNLPEVAPLETDWQGIGEIYFSKGAPILFEHALVQLDAQNYLLQGRDFARLKDIANTGHRQRLPYIIRQLSDSQDGLIRDWQYISTEPDKHLAYAIQWFAMAAALTIIFLLISIKNKRPD
ncbi:MAG: SURF1 family protein [Gammaproteobacteria bacterium]|nr:SURF1 family protein [Gammaproteobacteria bacterium]